MSSLGGRMKEFEQLSRSKLLPRIPVIIRIDGKSFHTFTKYMNRPWDHRLSQAMWDAALYTCNRMMGARLAYIQSDECSILLSDWDSYNTRPWFEYRVQKICSLTAAFYTAAFLRAYAQYFAVDLDEVSELPIFDTRAFNLPRHEVVNYFIWRQQDATRNSVQMLARAHFSHKKTQKKNNNQLQEMLWQEHQINWNDCKIWQKRGACIRKVHQVSEEGKERQKWKIDQQIPSFSQERGYIEKHITEVHWKEK